MDNKNYTAIVQKIIKNGNHGPYAVASNEDLGLITFSLEPTVWKEKKWPEGGSIVVLSEMNKKRAGWRANFGRFFEPSDEKSHQKQKQQGESE